MKFKVKSVESRWEENAAGGFFSLPASSASHLQASGGSQRGNQVTANERRERERERVGIGEDKDRKHT